MMESITFALLLVAFISTLIPLIGYKRRNKLLQEDVIKFEGDIKTLQDMHAKKTKQVNELTEAVKRLDYLLGQSMPLDQNGPRISGKTTRLIAYYVDLLFRSPEHKVELKGELFSSLKERNLFLNRLEKRLRFEHDVMLKVLKGNVIALDARKSRQTVALLNRLETKVKEHEQSTRKHSGPNETINGRNRHA